MKTNTFLLLKWKSFVRHPLVEQMLTIRLLLWIYLLSFLFTVYFSGLFLEQFAVSFFPCKTDHLILFLFFVSVSFILDFILKFFFKKQELNLFNFQRFPGSNKSLLAYSVVKEVVSFWNVYLIFFFFSYLSNNITSQYGLFSTIIIVFTVYIIQILISVWVSKIRTNKIEKNNLLLIALNGFSENAISNYFLINVIMIIRSPRLRHQLIIYLLLTSYNLYLVYRGINTDSFSYQLFFIAILLSFFPIAFNQFLFSAEASFFDHLMIIPGFKKNLTAKYILYLLFSGISFFVLLFILPFTWERVIELTAIFLYCMGTITLLSFCCILFLDTKMDLFGPFYKSFTNSQSVITFVMLLVFSLSIFLAIFIAWLFSKQAAIYFMMISGGIFILFHKRWFNYLYRCFYPTKYEKLEIFRIQ